MYKTIVIVARNQKEAIDFAKVREIQLFTILCSSYELRKLGGVRDPLVYQIGNWYEMEGDCDLVMAHLRHRNAEFVRVEDWR